jgi:hypothetical protein
MNFHIKCIRPALLRPGLVAALLAAIVTLWPQATAADPGVCYDDHERDSADPAASLRERASLLAPSLRLEAWYQPDRRERDDERVPVGALAGAGAQTMRHYADVRAGWQIDANWDLLDLTDLAVPDLFGETARLEASGCDELVGDTSGLTGDTGRLFVDGDDEQGGER